MLLQARFIWLLATICMCLSVGVAAETKHIDLVVAGSNGQKILRVELADTHAAWQTGLMFVEHLETDHGMLFVFPDEEIRNFWMKNTYIPLDMLFFDGRGRLINKIVDVPPLTLTTRRSTRPARYVLEVAGKASETWNLGTEIHFKLPLASR